MGSSPHTVTRIVVLLASLGLATGGCGELTEGRLVGVGYTPDGRIVAFGTDETRIFDADARHPLRTIQSPWRGSRTPFGAQLAVSTDGASFVVGNGKAVDVYDVESGELRAHIVVNEAAEERYPIAGAALSQDGGLVAVAVRPAYFGLPRLGIWRVDDQALVVDIQQPSDRHYWDWGAGLAFSSDARTLYALCTGDTGTRTEPRRSTALTAWNTADGTLAWEKWVPSDSADLTSGDPSLLALSADGSTLATAGAEILRWDTATATLLTSASVPSSPYGYSSIAFSPNGAELVTTHGTEHAPDPQIFAPDGSEVRSWTIAESGMCSSATFSPDGSRIAAACGQWLRIWDAATGAVIQSRKVASTIY